MGLPWGGINWGKLQCSKHSCECLQEQRARTQPGLATNSSQGCCTDASCVRLLGAHMRTSASLALSVAAA